MRALAIYYEMILLAILLIIGANSTVQFVNQCSQPMLSYTNEKTAFDTDDVVSWANPDTANSNVRYGKDLLLSLLNTDDYACYPNAIKIDNSPIFKLNSAFQTKKISLLKQIYDPAGDYKLGAKLEKKIKGAIYEVQSDGTAFIHYYIDTNPPT